MSTPSPKRIVRIVSRLNISGKAVQAILLNAEMSKLGYDCVLISGNPHEETDNLDDLVSTTGIETINIDEYSYRNPLSVLRAIWQLYQHLKQYQPDVVHTHNSAAGFTGRIAARLSGVPVIVHTLHEYPFRGYYSRLQTITFIYLERFGALLSDSIITLSQSLRKALSSTYQIAPKSRITVLPIGFDLQSFAETKRHIGTFRSEWDFVHDAPLIGIIGRLQPVKNHRLFLETALEILKVLPDAQFAIIGDGDPIARARVEQDITDLELREQVVITGWQQNMEAIYSDLDVLVNCSLNEGTPIPIIEALVAQCPVVATDVGGIADLLDNGQLGELVPSGDRQQLVSHILAVLDNPPDMTIAQKTMLRRYSIERLAQDLDSLYRGLFAKSQQ